MSKKKQNATVESIALQINRESMDFDSSMDVLSKELKDLNSIKCVLVDKIKKVHNLTKKAKKLHNSLDNVTKNVLNRLQKTEKSMEISQAAFVYERQIRMQHEDQVMVMEEQMEQMENDLTNSQIMNDDLREDVSELKKRIDFVKEAKIHQMVEICEKFSEVKEIITSENFVSNVRAIQEITADSDCEEGICVICKSKKNNHIFIPCGHQCVCDTCAPLVELKCPYCQSNFSSIQKVYVV